MENHSLEEKLITLNEFSKIVGVKPGEVRNAIYAETFKSAIKNPLGNFMIYVPSGIKEWAEHKKAEEKSMRAIAQIAESHELSSVPDVGSPEDLEYRFIFYKSELARVKFEREAKKLIELEKVKKEFFKIARQVRDAMMVIPDRLSAELANESDEFMVNRRLTDEIRRAISELDPAGLEVSFLEGGEESDDEETGLDQ